MADVADASHREGAAALSEADFRALFDASSRPHLLIAGDPPRYTMLAVNAAHARAFLTTPEALVGHGVFEVFPARPDATVAAFRDAVRASLDRVIATAAPDLMPAQAHVVPLADGSGAEERYWGASNVPILDRDGRVVRIVSAVQDLTGEVLERRSEEARALLMLEVDHRARNALTVVQSILRLTEAPDIEAFKSVVAGRVEALARAQASLARRKWEGALLGDVIDDELAALTVRGKYRLEGPRVLLRAQDVQAMSMVIHELATNASKYGALSTAAGALKVDWTVGTAGGLVLNWCEQGGPAVTPPGILGFGSRLILGLARQLNGEVRYDWRPTGLVAELTAAVER